MNGEWEQLIGDITSNDSRRIVSAVDTGHSYPRPCVASFPSMGARTDENSRLCWLWPSMIGHTFKDSYLESAVVFSDEPNPR